MPYKQVTLAPAGADGSAVATKTILSGQAGVITHLAIDYQNQPATTDILIKDSDTNGATLFTRTSSNTDLAPTAIVAPSVDEGGAAGAATDAGSGGLPFQRGIFIDVAQGDGQTSGDEKIVFKIWYRR